MKIGVIGSGLSGTTSAILLKEMGHDVEIFESRNHIGGNCFDSDVSGVKVHQYGAHIFHTNDDDVWNFLNRYTTFNDYEHKVRANTRLGRISIPYNKTTTNQIGSELSPDEITELIFKNILNDIGVLPGKNYPSQLPIESQTKETTSIPRYFTDKYQGIPSEGYTKMFNAMLNGITVHSGVSKSEYKRLNFDFLVYTGKPDDFFDHCFGKLPYRSLRFEHFKSERKNEFSFQDGAVINECNKLKFNRTVDNSVFLNQNLDSTILTRDYPQEHDDSNEPIYPKNYGESLMIFEKYKKLMQKEKMFCFWADSLPINI